MKSLTKGVIIAVAVIFCAVLALKGSALLISSGTWQATGNLSVARAGASAALLQDGRILITGGNSGSGTGAGPQASADLFNTDGTISPASPMTNARSGHISVTLQNGKVLVVGGITAGGSAASTAEVFDPIANSWTPMGLGMNEARSGATAALLSDGRVLIAGGQNGTAISSTIETFDPNFGVFTSAGMMSSPRTQHAMTVLQDGRVLIVGGNNGTVPVASTDIFDPVAGVVSAGPTLATARFGHSATTLLNGLVVVIGGNNGNANPAQVDATPAEIVDFTAATPAFTTLATNLATPREGHLAVLLPNNNNILIVGGTSAGTTIASAELFTPQESPQGVWTYGFGTTGTMTAARSAAAGSANQVNAPNSTMVRNGVVMVAGGNDASGNALNTTEAYGYATVQTDQNDYPPGTTVTMNGSGFKPGETITIQLVESPLIDTHGPYTVRADANGNFTDTSFMTDLHDVSVLFYLTATGGTSGFQAQNTFTDGNASSGDGTMTVSPLIVAAGSTGNSFTFTFTSQNGKDFNAGSQATILVPSGWTAPTSGNVTVTNGTCTAASLGSISGSTITINMTCPGGDNFTVAYGGVTAPTAAGSNTFTTKTKQNGGSLTSISTSPSVTVQAASKLVFGQQPTSTQAGAAITPAVTVKVEDANGDLVNTSTASVTITASGGTLSGTTTVNASSGVATFSNLSINNAGTNYTLTASSSGLTSATSSAFNITQASTTTTITNATALATATVVGQGYTVQYSVTVNPPGSGTPTGNVTVSDGSASCTATASAGSCLLSSTSVGTPKTITATYAGDSNFATSTSAGVSHTVNKASTSTTITSNLSTATVVGQPYSVAYTVAVNSPGSGTPTGNVTVSDGSASCTATVGAGGCSLTSTSVGAPKTITATYAGDSNFNGSTSAGVSHTVNQASTTTALTSSANPSVFGQSVTFTATVTVNSPGAGTIPANETVTFKDGVTTLGTGTTNASGVASFITSALTVATHSITAVYAGDTNFATSTGALSQVVNQAATTTALTSSANPSVFGQSVTFTAAVTVNSPGAGTIPANETVTFKDGVTTIGTGTTSASGVATFATTALTVATHSITAVYAGDTNFATSTSTAVSQVVNKASTTTTITNDLSTATVVGQAYSVSVSVTINAPGAGTIPNGDTVTVSDGSATCTVTLSSAAGSCSLTSTTAGNKTITATYNGDANFNTSTSAGVAHTVNKANTTTTITSNTPNPSTVGSAVTINYSVTVNSPGAGTPTGNVTVSDVGGDTCTGTVAAGTCSITFATAGTKTLTATYVGDTNFNTSASAGTSQTVNPKLAFTSTAFAILTGTCSSTISIQIQNANGSAATLATATVLNLSSNSGTGKFFSDAACTAQITTATIAAGTSTASFFYDDTSIGSPVITVASTGLTSVTQAETITGLRFGSAAFSVPVNTCSTAISVQSANSQSGGNPTSLTQATTINLSSSPASGKFYSNAACTTQITSTTISPTIDAGHDSPSFFYENASAGSATLTASAGTASAQQTESVVTPPSISKAFGAAMIPVNGTTSLSFTITNPAANTVALAGIAFTDTLPAGLVVATPNGFSSTCGGTTTATAGTGTVSLATGTVAANGSCAISVNVTGTTSGVKNNSVTVSSTNGGTGNTSTASITVASPPTISKAFGASSITLNTSTSLTFTITNLNTIGLTGVAFSDSLPAGLVVATPSGLNSTCGGTTTALAGSGSASLGGGTVAASSSCSISLNVTATALGTQNNTTGTITSNESGPGATSNTAMLTVTGTPPSFTSPASTTFTAGVAGSFTVMTSGTPTPSLSDGGVMLPGSVTFTDNHNGTATLAGTATVAGSYQFTITAQNAVGTATQAFTLVVNAGAAASISVASGSGQIATVNTAFTNPLVALVQDIYGNAVPSVTVTFAAPGSGPSGTFANGVNTAMTNAGGMATSATFTANNTAGSYTVTASAPSVTNMASFSLTNTAGSFTQLQLLVPGETAAPGTATGKTGTPNTEYVNGAFNVTVNAVDQYWNVVTTSNNNPINDTVQFTSNDSKAKLPSSPAPTLSAGTGTFSVTLETVSYNPATTTITASDVTDGSKTASTSPAITVIVVYTATISPTMAGTGDATPYTLTVNNAAAPNTNTLASVEIAVPTADQGTITGATVTATNQGPSAVNWTFDSSKLPGTLRFFENTANDAVTPGGTITITFTATSNATISMSPVYEVWNTTAFSDAASQNALPLAPPEPTVSIGQAPAITSASSTNAFTYGTPNTIFTVSATGTPIPTLSESGSFPSWATFKDNGDRTATISGTPTAAGTSTFTITAHNGFGPDATQTFMLMVQKADQTITVTMPAPAMAVYNTNFTVAATASSGNAVSFSSSGVCMNSGATFTMTSGTGSCTVKFDQAGDSNYNAAPEITESVAAQKAGQTITVTIPAPTTAFFASQFTVAATASSGNTVSFYSSGVCMNSGATFTMTSGTGICTVKFEQAGDANYNPAPEVTESVTAERVPQTINFGALSDQTFGDPPFTVSATATSSLAVMFSSLTPTVCTTSGTYGSTVTMIAAGTCTIEADQPGDADYLPAPSVTQSFKVNKAVTTTTLSPSGAAVVGGPVTFTVSVADASAGSTGTPSGTVTISDGNYAIGLITLSSGGGSFTTTLLSSTGSPHNINAHYNGDPNFQTSDATAVSQVINTRGTSTTLAFNPAQGTFAAPDTITAIVAEAAGLPSPSGTPDSFTGSGNLGTARKGATATQLLSGLILVVGGRDANSNFIGSAELYNPATGNSAPSGGTPIARYGAAAALLADGRVLIVGGTGSGGVLNSAEIYNPVTDSFSSTASLSVARASTTATPLTSGKVVVIGGSDGTSALTSVEVFDPAANGGTGAFSNPGSGTGIETARFGHVAALLANGTILVAGGNSGSAVLNSAEIYDPTANTSTALMATLSVAREFAGAAEMPNNYVLVAGGDSDGSTPLGSADLYDPQSQKFYASNATLGTARTQLAAVQLNDGRVLAVGGAGPVPPSTNAALASVEPYTPAFTPQGAVALSSTGSGDSFTGTCQLQPATPATSPAQSTCTETIDPGSAGTDSVTGNYPADVVHSSSSSGAVSFIVNPATTSTTVSSSANPSIYGQSVTFTAVVSNTSTGSTGIPTGSVNFSIDGGAAVTGTSASCPSGSPTHSLCATYSTASLTVSSSPHSVSATYTNSDGNFIGSSGSLSPGQTVQKATPVFSNLTGSQTITYGTPSINLAGTISAPCGPSCMVYPPSTETVSIAINGVTVTPAIGSNGSFSATFNTSTIPASMTAYAITYSYNTSYADTNFKSATDASTTLTVQKATPVFSNLTASQTITYGTPSISLAGIISAPCGMGCTIYPPSTETVSIMINGVTVTPAIGSNGSFSATFTTSTIPASVTPYTITYSYNANYADTNFKSATDASTTLTVQKATPVFSNLSASQTITYGTPSISLVGTISAPCGMSCTVYPPSTDTVSITINGVAVTPAIGSNGSFSTTFTTGTIPASSTPYAITYSYNANYADTNFKSATDATTTLTVQKATPVFSNLTASQTIPYGTATITVTGKLTAPTATPPNMDSVTVSINGTSVSQTVSLSGGSFTATLSTAATPASMTAYAISYSFTGDSNFNPASDASTSLTVKPVPLSITAASGMMTYGGTLPTINTGNATYVSFVNGEGVSVLGAGFSCSTTATSSSPVGTYPTNCSGAVDSNYVISYTPGAITVKAAPLMITASSGSMTYGGSPFVVMPMFSGLVNGDTPATFNVSPNIPPTCLPILTSTTPAGTYTSTCTGAMDNNYSITPVSGSVTILQANTSTTVSSSLNPSNWGNVVALTATVSDSSTNSTGAPTGTVSFYNNIGTTCPAFGTITPLDTEPLSLTSPYTASTSTPSLPVGTDTILACYNGDINFYATSTGNGTTTTLSQVVIAAPIATLAPANLSFGGQQGGTVSGAQIVYVCNGPSGASGSPCFNAPVSTAALVIQSIGFTNPNTNPAYFTQTSTCPNGGNGLAVGGSCPINVRFAPPLNTQGIATALLTVTDNNENVPGSTQSASLVGAGTSAVTGVGSLSTYAIFGTANGCSSVNVSGNGTVDSFGGSTTSGNVGTNGNVTLSGNPVVNGAVYSPLGGTGSCTSKTMTGLSTSGKAQATGGQVTLSQPVVYSAPPTPTPPTTTQNISGSCGTISGGCTNNGTKNVTLAPGQYGNLSVSGGTTVNVSGGTYNVNSLSLSGNSSLVVTPNTGPVVVNLAGKSLSGGNAVLDLSGGSMSNSSGMASNLQFYYAGSQPIKLSGGTGSYAIVYAPNAPINVSGGSHFYGSIIGSTVNSSGNTAIHYPTALASISSDNSIWFSSSGLTVKGLPNTGSVKLYVTNASISFMANGTTYNLPVPNAVITFSSTASSASTTWDATNKRWSTIVPTSSVNGVASIHTFFDGIAYQVPSGFPTGIQNVTWQAAYSTSQTGLSFNWQWGAAVYSSFTNNYSSLTVNPIDNNPLYGSDPAGTPENYKSNLVFGDTGAGYTGLYANFVGVVPTIAPMNVAPSSYDFGVVSPGGSATTPPGTFVLTNNDSVPYTISSSGIQMTGTYAGDFAQTNTCGALPVTLPGGGSCTFSVTFTPSAASGTKETAKIVINDNANNSPQTVFLKGTVQ